MHANEQLIRSLFGAFGRRDLNEAVGLFAEDVVFCVPGRSGISGTYRGHAGVLEYWRRQIESTGSFRTEVMSVELEDDHVVVSVDITAERDGTPASWRRIVDYRIDGGKIVEASVAEADQDAADAFFAAGD
jgi:ketosteroid isomerase-like protein